MTYWKCIWMPVVGLLRVAALVAQSQDTTASSWSAGGVEFSGLLDGYFSYNLNHPSGRVNQVRVFDVRANQLTLNLAKLSMERAADPVGFRVDVGLGRGMDLFHFNEPDFSAMKYLEQAFVIWKPKRSRGFQADFGKFVSSAGVQLLNGWNNVEDNNTDKTIGLTGTIASGNVSWTNTYYVGREKSGADAGLRHLYDSVLRLSRSPKLSTYINFDYAVDRMTQGGKKRWVGIAGAVRYQVSNRFALAPRVEWFNDADGFNTGTVQKLKEFTLTGEVKMAPGLLTRLEYRRDWSDRPHFNRGDSLSKCRSQDTLLAGVVASFGLK